MFEKAELGSPLWGELSNNVRLRGVLTLLKTELLHFARGLRKTMTPHERKLWFLFLRSYPVKFYKQKVIGSCIVDFYCPAAKLAIEIDGTQHYYDAEIKRDQDRTVVLELQGINVIRFSNKEIDTEFSAVCERIDFLINQKQG